MFSIIIPTFNNIKYLKLCIGSIKKNSTFKHEIIVHVNLGEDGTKEFLDKENIKYTFTNYNAGICEGMNKATKKASFDFILYSHDDFYFCPNWDKILNEEIKKIGHNRFYLSGIMMNNGPLKFDAGTKAEDFDEKKLLKDYEKEAKCLNLDTGLFAITIDQGRNTEPYQGITPIIEGSLIKSAENYFFQSGC